MSAAGRERLLDAVDEVPQMGDRLLAGVGGDRLGQVVDLPAPAIDDERSRFAVKGGRRAAAFHAVRAPKPVLPNDRGAGIGILHDQRVGRLLVVVEMETSAGGRDPCRQADAQAPAGDVEHVSAPVPQFARSVIPEPVPVVMEPIGVERHAAEPGRATDRNRRRRVACRPACGRSACGGGPSTLWPGERRPAGRCGQNRRPTESVCRCAAAGRTGPRGRTAARRPPSAGLPERYARRVFRRRRLFRPGRPEWSSARANGRAWRSRRHRSVWSSRMRRKSDSQRGDFPCTSAVALVAAGRRLSSTSQRATTSTSGSAARCGGQSLSLVPHADRRHADPFAGGRLGPALRRPPRSLRPEPTMPAATPAAFLALEPKNCRRLTSCLRKSSTFMRTVLGQLSQRGPNPARHLILPPKGDAKERPNN